MAIDVPGIIGVVVCDIVILVIGIWAGRRKASNTNAQFLANRELGIFVTSCTLAGTNFLNIYGNEGILVGGAYIYGTAKVVGRDGVLWSIGPVCMNIGAFIASFILAPKLRRGGYTTIVDPLQERFGKKMGTILFFNELFANLFWEAAILGTLGSSLSLILDINMDLSIIISACVAVTYTLFGGLYSVAYTDVIQLIFITVGLILAVPFIYTNEAVDISRVDGKWFGSLPPTRIGMYIDTVFLCICGSMSWQGCYQRILACKSPELARMASVLGAVISALTLIPSSLIGIAGAATNWNMTVYSRNAFLSGDYCVSVLPMALKYLCPTVVSLIGLGAITAAVMSSADSLVLATGSVFARNIYPTLFRPQALEGELIFVLRIAVLVVGATGTMIALTARSVYALMILCVDVMYVVHFPQVICVLYLPVGNTYGSLTGFIIGLVLRCLSGEPTLGFPVIIKLPMYDEETNTQLFPFKTFSMLCSMLGIVGISYITDVVFQNKLLSNKLDIFRCFPDEKSKDHKLEPELPRESKYPYNEDISEDNFDV